MGFSFESQSSITVTNTFQIILDGSEPKSNKTWADKSSDFYNTSMKSWLQDNDTENYSTHNEGKSIVVEGFMRALMNKIYKYMVSVSKNVYMDKLDDIVNEYNQTYHRTIKMTLVDTKLSTHIDFGIENK